MSVAMIALLGLALVVPPGSAAAQAPPPPPPGQPPPPPPAAAAPAAPTFKPEELDQIAAPIALYPDPLLAQIFMASTYPIEVVQAARFMKAHPDLKGDALDQELKNQTWDDSVKSLVTFPQVLSMMNDKLDWMQKLGDAFLAQQADLMSAVQRLRAKAHAEGSLKDTKEQKVTVEVVTPPPAPAGQAPAPAAAPPTVITIQPTNPQVVYVPTYNPTVVYGGWPYPAYPPYAYYPPGYVAGTALLSFTAGVAVGAALWGNCNWGGGDVNINNNQYNNFTKNVNNANVSQKRSEIQNARASGQGGKWQHDPEHRKGVQYRDQGTQQRFNRGDSPNAQSRESFRGRAEQGRSDMSRGQGGGFQGNRAQGTTAGGRGDGGFSGRGSSAGGARGTGVQQTRGGGAFDGVGSGGQTRAYSDRGSASRQAGAGGGARAGGGGGGGGGRAGGGGRGGGRR